MNLKKLAIIILTGVLFFALSIPTYATGKSAVMDGANDPAVSGPRGEPILVDNSVTRVLNTGSTSTIRNHRFTLREKQKQAKVFLAIMELLAEQAPKKGSFIDIPRSTAKIDDRFAITKEEYDKILSTYFQQGPDGPISSFPLKEKKRIAILKHILKYFEADRTYTEKEVNAVLEQFHNDYVLLRRCLIEYGFMDRVPDGSSYWVKL